MIIVFRERFGNLTVFWCLRHASFHDLEMDSQIEGSKERLNFGKGFSSSVFLRVLLIK